MTNNKTNSHELTRNIHFPFLLPFLLFITCLAVYIIFWSGHQYSIDGIVMFQYAKVILFKGSLFFDPPLMWGVPFETSKWPIGMTLIYIPVLFILSSTIFHANPEISQIPSNPSTAFPPEYFSNRPYFYSSLANPIITALTVILVYYFGITLGFSKRNACIAALIFGLVSPATVYARFDFAQPLASLLLIAALLLFFQSKQLGSLGKLTVSGVFLGFAILTRPELVIIPGMVMVALSSSIYHPLKNRFWWLGPGLFILPIGLSLLVNQIINSYRFGTFLRFGYNLTSEFSLDPLHFGMAFVGNLFSPGRGIFIFFPISTFGILGLVQLYKRDRWSGLLIGSVTLGFAIFYSTWKQWDAGISWGPRFLIPALPYLTLLALSAYNHFSANYRRMSSFVFILLLIFGGIANLQGLLFNFLGFYSSIQLSDQVSYLGLNNFNVSFSPIFAGWNDLFHPTHYDIVWFQKAGGQGYYSMIAYFLFFITGGLMTLWFFLLKGGKK